MTQSTANPVNDLPAVGGGRCARGWALAFLLASCLFGLTAAPTIQWQDSGLFVVRVLKGELINPLGLALSHPLPYWLVEAGIALFSLAPSYVASLISALFGAVAVANVYWIGVSLTRRPVAAAVAAGGLAVANTFWRLSTIPESYTLMTALLTWEIMAILRWDRTRRPLWLLLAFAANGLGLADHNMALLTLPVIGMVAVLAVKRRQLSALGLAGAIGIWLALSSPFTGLVILAMFQSGEVIPTISSALFGHSFAGAVIGVSHTWRYTAVSLFFTAYSFPNLTLPASLLGIMRARRLGIPILSFVVLLADLLIHLTFVLRYGVVDQYTFLLPAYALLAIFATIGLAWILARWTRRIAWVALAASIVLVVLTPALYAAGPKVFRSFHLLGSAERHKPYRDDYIYLLVPWGIAQSSTDQMSREAVDLAGPDGRIIVEDAMARFGVEYQLWLRGWQETVELIVAKPYEMELDPASDRKVVLIPSDTRDQPQPPGAWQRVGDLYVRAGGR